MRVLVTSDFHGYLPPRLPATDLLIIAGDITGGQHGLAGAEWLQREFAPWLEKQKAEWIVGIAGNHDFVAEANPNAFRDLPWTYLHDSGCDVGGFKVWGSPWANKFGNWAFMETDDVLAQHWALIPDDTEILIVHGPAKGINDKVWDGRAEGSISLRERLRELPDLKLLATGHIHEAHGEQYIPTSGGGFVAVNGCYVTLAYRGGVKPIAMELTPRENVAAPRNRWDPKVLPLADVGDLPPETKV